MGPGLVEALQRHRLSSHHPGPLLPPPPARPADEPPIRRRSEAVDVEGMVSPQILAFVFYSIPECVQLHQQIGEGIRNVYYKFSQAALGASTQMTIG